MQKKQAVVTEQQLEKNIKANEAYIQQYYPDEVFITTTAQLQAANRYTRKLVLPANIRVAVSRINIKSNEERRILKKELKQAGILSRKGNSVFLTPEKPQFGIRVTDGVINGIPYEFRNVTGTVKKIEKRFSDAKEKGDAVNVYLNLENNADINEAKRRIYLVLERHPEYTGKIIVSTRDKEVYFWDTGNFWE